MRDCRKWPVSSTAAAKAADVGTPTPGMLMRISQACDDTQPTAHFLDLLELHALEIWSWATLHLLLKALPDLEQALNFSTSNYVTIGHGDVALPISNRILGVIEGASDIILTGWSTAFFFDRRSAETS